MNSGQSGQNRNADMEQGHFGFTRDGIHDGNQQNDATKVAVKAGLKDIILVDNEKDAAATLTSAVQKAASLAERGDTVLLSPACASWDMFPSYEVRGDIFKEAVHNL